MMELKRRDACAITACRAVAAGLFDKDALDAAPPVRDALL